MTTELFAGSRPIALPGGDVIYDPHAIAEADRLFHKLMDETPWAQEQIRLFGQTRNMPRLTCWMGDAPYTYSGLENVPAPWTKPVLELRSLVEELTRTTFNGVLLNLYRGGADSMGRHADDEASLGPSPVIASVSLGTSRRFRFVPKPHHQADPVSFELEHGSVLIMRGDTQANWFHEIPKTKREVGPRINLTFRHILSEDHA